MPWMPAGGVAWPSFYMDEADAALLATIVNVVMLGDFGGEG